MEERRAPRFAQAEGRTHVRRGTPNRLKNETLSEILSHDADGSPTLDEMNRSGQPPLCILQNTAAFSLAKRNESPSNRQDDLIKIMSRRSPSPMRWTGVEKSRPSYDDGRDGRDRRSISSSPYSFREGRDDIQV